MQRLTKYRRYMYWFIYLSNECVVFIQKTAQRLVFFRTSPWISVRHTKKMRLEKKEPWHPTLGFAIERGFPFQANWYFHLWQFHQNAIHLCREQVLKRFPLLSLARSSRRRSAALRALCREYRAQDARLSTRLSHQFRQAFNWPATWTDKVLHMIMLHTGKGQKRRVVNPSTLNSHLNQLHCPESRRKPLLVRNNVYHCLKRNRYQARTFPAGRLPVEFELLDEEPISYRLRNLSWIDLLGSNELEEEDAFLWGDCRSLGSQRR